MSGEDKRKQSLEQSLKADQNQETNGSVLCARRGTSRKTVPKARKNQGQKENGDVVASEGYESSEVLCVAKDKTESRMGF